AVAVEAWVREVERRAAGAAASGGSFGAASSSSIGFGGGGASGGDGVIGAWVSELLARADECLAQIAPAPASARTAGQVSAEAEETLELRRLVKGLKRSVDGILGGEGLLGGSLFR